MQAVPVLLEKDGLGLTPSRMVLLVIFNAVTTALYTLLLKVASSVYGNKHATFLIWAVCVVEYSCCSCVVLCSLLAGKCMRSLEPTPDSSVPIAALAAGTLLSPTVSDRASIAPTVACAALEPAALAALTLTSATSVNLTSAPSVNAQALKEQSAVSTLEYLRLNALAALCSSVPDLVWAVTGVQVLGSIQAVLNLLLIPCTYILARLFLKQHFHWWQKLGCVVVVLGAGVALIPSLSNDDGSASTVSLSPLMLGVCYFLFAAANLPYAYQYIVVERMLRAGHGLFGLEMTSGWLQVGMLLTLAPLQGTLLRTLGEEPSPFSLAEGLECFLGRDPDCLSSGTGDEKIAMPSWWPGFILIVVSVASLFNDLAYYVLVKYGSAIFMSVAEGASASLVAAMATASFMGPYRETGNVYMVVSCIVCSFGMLAWYRGERHAALSTELLEARLLV